jgi:hypothetical protein
VPSPVQTARNSITSGTSCTVTLGAATGSGNTLVAVMYAGAASISSITLGGGTDNWGHRADIDTASVGDVAIWSDPGCAGGQTSIVVTQATSNPLGVIVYELPGNCSLDVAGSGHGQNDGAAGFTAGTTGTTNHANEWWIAVVGGFDGSGATVTMTTPPSSPWVNEPILNYDTYAYIYTSYQATTSTGTPTYTGTASPASGVNCYGSIVATFVQAGGTTVALPVAQVTVAAAQPSTGAGPVALPVAQVAVAAPVVTPSGARVALPAAQLAVAALPVTPVTPGHVALPAAQLAVAALPVTPSGANTGAPVSSLVPFLIAAGPM